MTRNERDYATLRASASEKARTVDLLRLLPKGRSSALDVGARDGFFSRHMAALYPRVTAIDLRQPDFQTPGVVTATGDVTKLQYPDNSFDVVFCAEVLEHVENVSVACKELLRVAKHEVIVGVPFRQDIRLGRTTCHQCGRTNPPWGHINAFDEERIRSLFAAGKVTDVSFVGVNPGATNWFSAALMDWAGNPWGTYQQEEPCINCGCQLLAPTNRTVQQRVLCGIAHTVNQAQARFLRPRANWIHVVVSKCSM